MLVVTMPKTAMKMSETRNVSTKNGIMKTMKRKSRTKSKGRRMYQPNRKKTTSTKSNAGLKTSCNHFSTNLMIQLVAKYLADPRRPQLCEEQDDTEWDRTKQGHRWDQIHKDADRPYLSDRPC